MAGLSACGFSPAYGPEGKAAALSGKVRVDDPADRDAFDLVERLEERLGRPEAPRFGLGYAITTDTVGLGITPENAITRYNLVGSIRYRLRDLATDAEVYAGTADSFTGYSASGTTVATLTAELDAHERLMRLLADQIVSQLIAGSAAFAA